MTAAHRPLTPSEINQLCAQGCTCSQWSNVSVDPDFDAGHVHASHFSGITQLGRFQEEVDLGGGALHPTGIYRATCHNCSVGDHTLIRNVGGVIANMDIADHVVIDHVGRIDVSEKSTFGNNTPIHTVSEAGGRAVPLYDRLSAPLAYLIAFFRDDLQLVERLTDWIAAYAQHSASDRGTIGSGACLRDCGAIHNTRIGPAAQLIQVSTLENGSIQSCPNHPTQVGPGVIARHFILAEGATVTDGSRIDHCFIGQGAVLQGFKAEHSLFFANCEAYLGEACAVFAGPCTVSHHQGSLLIAAYLSFFNAGSHTNQSNHMYRLGPYHQGILERGCKTASGAYLCWPAHIGAFSLVKGRHYTNPDLADLPFSYLIEKQEHSVLHPGAALGTVGLTRDAWKWEERDRRSASHQLDPYTSDPLNPYTMEKVLRAISCLTDLLAKASDRKRPRSYRRTRPSRAAMERGLQLYQWARDQFWGDCLINTLSDGNFTTKRELCHKLAESAEAGSGPWLDLAGLLVPARQVHQLIGDIHNGVITTLDAVSLRLDQWQQAYDSMAFSWAVSSWREHQAVPAEDHSCQALMTHLTLYKEAKLRLTATLLADGGKEYDTVSRVGYGLESTGQASDVDFKAVRGTAQDNPFLQSLTEKTKLRIQQADAIMTRIQALPD